MPSVQAQNPDADKRIKELQEQIKKVNEQLELLRDGGGANTDDPFSGQMMKTQSGLRLSFYGEAKYNWTRGSKGNYFDPHRFVLIPTYQVNDWIYFNSELELEHGGVESGVELPLPRRFRGALELEQFYADVKVNDWLTWRSLGVSLIPVGSVNLVHEPTTFYSVHRPIMYKYIVPSTWMEGATGFHGEMPGVEGLSWQFLISQGLSTVGDVTGGGGRIQDGAIGVRETRPRLDVSGRPQDEKLAYSFRLAYDGSSSEQEWLKGFSGSLSTYIGNYEETGALGDTTAVLWDVEGKYRFQSGALKNLELIADYAQWNFGTPEAISDVNVGDRMYGYRLEAAYHIPYGTGSAEVVPFLRYEGFDTSDGPGKAGFVETGSSNYLGYGASWFLHENMVLKGAMRQSLDDHSNTEFSVGVGWSF